LTGGSIFKYKDKSFKLSKIKPVKALHRFSLNASKVFLNEHNFFNLDQKIFVLIPKNREFNSLQENK
jgi:hypothetical protein